MVAAASERGHEPRVLDTLRFAIDLSGDVPDLQYRGRQLDDFDAVLPRIGASITFFDSPSFASSSRWTCTRRLPPMGLRTRETSSGRFRSSPDTTSPSRPRRSYDRADVLPAIDRVGGAPVVIKLLEGTQGIGVILAPDTKIAEAVIETLQSTRQNVLIQRFVAESRGRDVRALVVGGRVVAAMRRQASGDEFRSNVHRGGSVEAIDLDPVYADTAVRAAQIMGLRVAGVDMLEGADGPVVMEVNSSPGFEGIERATGLDIAGAIIDYVAAQVAFPEIDVRQRLSVSAGYGVVELSINEGAALVAAGTTIGELREQDISVLTLNAAPP